MSLYYEASAILTNQDKKGGSLKSRVFAAKDLKNPATKVYALLVETLKWSPVLKEVIERSEVLRLERKVCFCIQSRRRLDEARLGAVADMSLG
jgi:putative methyltransferase